MDESLREAHYLACQIGAMEFSLEAMLSVLPKGVGGKTISARLIECGTIGAAQRGAGTQALTLDQEFILIAFDVAPEPEKSVGIVEYGEFPYRTWGNVPMQEKLRRLNKRYHVVMGEGSWNRRIRAFRIHLRDTLATLRNGCCNANLIRDT